MPTSKLVALDQKHSSDAFYRYKRPVLLTQLQSGGNGVKIAITNLPLLSKALDRPVGSLLKHFFVDLGTNGVWKDDVAVLKGDLRDTIEDSVESFISRYVSCGHCGNPETTLVTNKKKVEMRCKACGQATRLDVDDKVVKAWIKSA